MNIDFLLGKENRTKDLKKKIKKTGIKKRQRKKKPRIS